MTLDVPGTGASAVEESLLARARRAAARVSLPLAGGGVLGGSGLSAAIAATGGCPLCAVGVPCPVCLLGAGPVLGSAVTGGLGTLGLAAWTGSSTPDEDPEAEDEDGDEGSPGSACRC